MNRRSHTREWLCWGAALSLGLWFGICHGSVEKSHDCDETCRKYVEEAGCIMSACEELLGAGTRRTSKEGVAQPPLGYSRWEPGSFHADVYCSAPEVFGHWDWFANRDEMNPGRCVPAEQVRQLVERRVGGVRRGLAAMRACFNGAICHELAGCIGTKNGHLIEGVAFKQVDWVDGWSQWPNGFLVTFDHNQCYVVPFESMSASRVIGEMMECVTLDLAGCLVRQCVETGLCGEKDASRAVQACREHFEGAGRRRVGVNIAERGGAR